MYLVCRPCDFTRLIDGISSSMCTQLDDIQEQIESICRDAAEDLAQDLGTGAPLDSVSTVFITVSATVCPEDSRLYVCRSKTGLCGEVARLSHACPMALANSLPAM